MEKYSNKWLYEELLNQWGDLIPVEYHETFRTKGYYSLVDGNIRFIVLNTNYCARLNLMSIYQHLDLGDMLKWLQLELQTAVLNGQFVYIVGHISPDYVECTTHWMITYFQIITIYSKVIKGQFFGHSHFDEIRIYYSPTDTNKLIGMAYLSPSVTTFREVNPAFRLYHTDPDTGTIVDHRTYFLNITEANQMLDEKRKPKWKLEYTARDSYRLQSMAPQEWEQMLTGDDQQLINKYYQHYWRYNENDAQKMMSKKDKLKNIYERMLVKLEP